MSEQTPMEAKLLTRRDGSTSEGWRAIIKAGGADV